MSQVPAAPGGPDDMQFDVVEPAAPPPAASGAVAVAGPVCVACKQPIVDSYFAIGGKTICTNCRNQLAAQLSGGSKLGRLSLATLLGCVAGLVGALVWWLIRYITHYEIGLIALLLGFMVGAAVRAGSGGRGGRGYQFLALAITWFAIGINYVPDLVTQVYHEMHKNQTTVSTGAHGKQTGAPDEATPASDNSATDRTANSSGGTSTQPPKHVSAGAAILALLLLIVIAVGVCIAAPIIANLASPIGWIIVGIALYEAWKINARRIPPITGPFAVSNAPVAQ